MPCWSWSLGRLSKSTQNYLQVNEIRYQRLGKICPGFFLCKHLGCLKPHSLALALRFLLMAQGLEKHRHKPNFSTPEKPF